MQVAPILHQHGPNYMGFVVNTRIYGPKSKFINRASPTAGPLGMTGIALWQRVFLAYMGLGRQAV